MLSAPTSLHFVAMSPKIKASKPALLLSKVPSITKLYEDLSILNTPARKVKAFSTELHKWRKSYKTSTDWWPATLLKDWNNPNVRSDLKEVVEAFFEEQGRVTGPPTWISVLASNIQKIKLGKDCNLLRCWTIVDTNFGKHCVSIETGLLETESILL
jgi:hypothetical protein